MPPSEPQHDDKRLFFDPYDGVPNYERFIAFERDLFKYGGQADDHGWSFADVFRGQDDGGANGAALPAAPADADERAIVRLRRKRLKGAHLFLVRHISNKVVTDKMSEPPLLGDGEAAFEWLRLRNCTAPDVEDQEALKQQWRDVSIVKDIGVSENTIIDLATKLDNLNRMIPNAPDRFNVDQKAEKILRAIAASSRTFAESATRELNAAAGPPGPLMRDFQRAPLAGAAGGFPRGHRHRDVDTMVTYYHTQWRAQVRSGALTKAEPTSRRAPGASHMVNRVDHARAGIMYGVDAPGSDGMLPADRQSYAPRNVSPTHTLQAVSEVGFAVQRGTTTTSDFEVVSQDELAAALCEACDDGTDFEEGPFEGWARRAGEQPEFSIEVSFDANDVMTIEMLCDNCRGAGHGRRHCPSPRKFRSFRYVADLNLRAYKRAEERAASRGDAAGGRRPPPRGQATPLKPGMPRKFQASHPFRRFMNRRGQPPGAPREQRGLEALTEESEKAPEGSGGGTGLEASRCAALSREGPQMPISFSLDHSDYFEQSAGGTKAESVSMARVSSVAECSNDATVRLSATAEAVPVSDVHRRSMYSIYIGLLATVLALAITYYDETKAATVAMWRGLPKASLVLVVMLLVTVRGVRGGTRSGVPRDKADVCMPSMMTPLKAETIEGVRYEKACIAPSQLKKNGERDESEDTLVPEYIDITTDSGATAILIPAEEEYLFSRVLERDPRIKLLVASDSPPLDVSAVGQINTNASGIRLVARSYKARDGQVTGCATIPARACRYSHAC